MNGKCILDVLVELKFTASKGEAKRLIQGGGVKVDGEKSPIWLIHLTLKAV